MVILQIKYQVRPDKVAEYTNAVQANKFFMDVPGLLEIQAYRNITGRNQITVFYMFED